MVLFSVYPDLPHIARFWMILPSQFRITQNKIHYISLRRHRKKFNSRFYIKASQIIYFYVMLNKKAKY